MIEKSGIAAMHMIQEVLSRARMREPQTIPSEASRSARQISMQARQRANREMLGR